MGIPTNLTPGIYQIVMDIGADSSNYIVYPDGSAGLGTYRQYRQQIAGLNYFIYDIVSSSYSTDSDTGLTASTIEVTAPVSISSTPVTCGTRTAPTAFMVTAIPSAFSSATAPSGECFFIMSMNKGALNRYSITLDSYSSEQSLSIHYDNNFTLPPQCVISATGSNSQNCPLVKSDSYDKLYIWVLDMNNAGSTFRLVTP